MIVIWASGRVSPSLINTIILKFKSMRQLLMCLLFYTPALMTFGQTNEIQAVKQVLTDYKAKIETLIVFVQCHDFPTFFNSLKHEKFIFIRLALFFNPGFIARAGHTHGGSENKNQQGYFDGIHGPPIRDVHPLGARNTKGD